MTGIFDDVPAVNPQGAPRLFDDVSAAQTAKAVSPVSGGPSSETFDSSGLFSDVPLVKPPRVLGLFDDVPARGGSGSQQGPQEPRTRPPLVFHATDSAQPGGAAPEATPDGLSRTVDSVNDSSNNPFDWMRTGGHLAKSFLTDIVAGHVQPTPSRLMPDFPNVSEFWQRGADKHFEPSEFKTLPTVGKGVADTGAALPQIGLGYMLTLAGVPAPVAFGGVMGGQAYSDTEGQPTSHRVTEAAKQAALGAVMPGASEFGTKVGGDALLKLAAKTGASETTIAAAETLGKVAGSQSMLNGLMVAAQAPELVQQSQTDPAAFRDSLIKIVAGNLAFELPHLPANVREVKAASVVDRYTESPEYRQSVDDVATHLLSPQSSKWFAENGANRASQFDVPGLRNVPFQAAAPAPRGSDDLSAKPLVSVGDAIGSKLDEIKARLLGRAAAPKPEGDLPSSSAELSTSAESVTTSGVFDDVPEAVGEKSAQFVPETEGSRPDEVAAASGSDADLSVGRSKAEQWADRVIAESAGRISSGIDPELLTAYGVKGAVILKRGVEDFAAWSREMLRQFGDTVSPHLGRIWNHAQALADVNGPKDPAEHIARYREMVDEGENLIRAALVKSEPMDASTWAQRMVGLFGDGVRPHLEDIYRDARAQGQLPIKQGSAAKPFNERQKQITIGERDALRELMRAREKGAREGYRAAIEEKTAVEKDLETVSASADKLRALTGKISEQLETLKRSDKWAAADAAHIRRSLLELVGELPPAQRGRFTAQITAAMERPAIGGSAEGMYRRAAIVAAKIQAHLEDVHKAAVIEAIRKVAARALDAPGVDVRYKRIIRAQLDKINLRAIGDEKLAVLRSARDVAGKVRPLESGFQGPDIPKAIIDQLHVLEKVPLRNLDSDTLTALYAKLATFETVGREAQKSRRGEWAERRTALLSELADSKTSPMNDVEGAGERRQAGNQETILMRIADKAAGAVNMAANVDKALLPIDAIFDAMDGGQRYTGFASRNFKAAVNLNRQRELVMRDEVMAQLDAIRKRHGLTNRNAERIGAYALLQQEGVARRLIAQGETAANLRAIVESITPGELEFYRTARRLMEQLRPQIADLMARLYNVELNAEENYWPLQRDWAKYDKTADPLEASKAKEVAGDSFGFDEMGVWNELAPDYSGWLRTNANKGFTLEREKGAQTAVKVNAFDVLEEHFRNVTHLLAHQEDLKMLGEIAKDDLFGEKYGRVGQKVVLDWLDTVARDGRAEGRQRNVILDALRRSTTMGIIPWNPVTMLVHTSQIPVSLALVTPKYFVRGALALLTPEGRAFVTNNMRSLAHRFGEEPAIAEVQRGGLPIANVFFGRDSWVSRLMEGYVRAGTLPIRTIDAVHAMTTAMGAYQRELAAKGINPDSYATHPVDAEALGRAMAISRRTVASVLPEDMPQMLSRGKSFAQRSGNVSLTKTLLQFGNTYLDIWSVLRHDLAGGTLRALRERDSKAVPFLGALGLMVVASVLWESGIRYGAKKVKAAVLGQDMPKDDTYGKEVLHESAKRFPFVGNAMAGTMGKTGVPVVDIGIDAAKAAKELATGRNQFGTVPTKPDAVDRQQTAAALKLGTSVGTLLGVPGAQLAGTMAQKAATPPAKHPRH